MGISSKIHRLGRSAEAYRVPQMHFYSIPYLLSAELVTKQKPEGFFLITSYFGNSYTTVMERKSACLLAEARLLQPVSKGYGVTTGTR